MNLGSHNNPYIFQFYILDSFYPAICQSDHAICCLIDNIFGVFEQMNPINLIPLYKKLTPADISRHPHIHPSSNRSTTVLVRHFSTISHPRANSSHQQPSYQPINMEDRHSISEPRPITRDPTCVEWEVDILRDDTVIVDTFVINNEILPPRTNKKGKVLWRLPDSMDRLVSEYFVGEFG